MRRNGGRWSALVVAAALALATVLGAGPSIVPANAPANALAKPVLSASNTITFAEAPQAAPNYIFPFLSCRYFSVANVSQFQALTYRPLYWFGTPGSAAVDYDLSPAKAPVFSNGDKTVVIDMKGWKFADGQRVDAQSVMFFLNLYKADPTSYCGYTTGYGIPDQVASATGRANTVTINFTSAVNPNWILYSYLSELTPMPNRWDVTATGASRCATGVFGAPTTDAACKDVETYLDARAAKRSQFADELWTSGADGPWKVAKVDSRGDATFVPNPTYSGPVKAHEGVDAVEEEAFSSLHAEEAALRSGTVTIGYVSTAALKGPAPAPGKVGANWSVVASKYRLTTGVTWGFNDASFNFGAQVPTHDLISQLYVRQALQDALDQPAIIRTVDKGYGVAIDSPLPPNTPPSVSGLAPALEPVVNPYPFNVGAAKALLASHGWKVVAGVETCESPGAGATECGAGVAAGTTLNVSVIWASGSATLNATMRAEVAQWHAVGFLVTRAEAKVNVVRRECSAEGTYAICATGSGRRYAPGYYPSGESLFAPGGELNVGQYSSDAETSAIEATIFGTSTLAAYAELTAQQLPVLFEPQAEVTTEVLKTLRAVQVNRTSGLTANPMQNFMPEYLYLR